MSAMITSLDYGVGRITSTLENTNQLNETIIVFLSDNGGKNSILKFTPEPRISEINWQIDVE